MKQQQITELVEMDQLDNVSVHRWGNESDGKGGFILEGYFIQFHFKMNVYSCVDLQTARGGLRIFSTLDAVRKFLDSIKIHRFEVW